MLLRVLKQFLKKGVLNQKQEVDMEINCPECGVVKTTIREHCVYCHRNTLSIGVPAVNDDKGWTVAAVGHRKNCEWITTRAHQC